MLANLQTAYGEASEVHMGATGYFAVFRKQAPKGKKQKLYSVSQMEDVMLAARNAPDTYVSQASFISAASRRISSVSSMGCAFVDIDCYKLGLAPDDRLVEQILGCATQLNLPEPTYVVSSGRGLYVKWLFTEQLPAAQIARWQRLQGVLIPLYRALGSDPGVRDAARVLRAVESINSAADNAVVRVIHASGRRVAFDDLWNAVASIDMSSLSDISSDRVAKTTAKMIERKVRAAAVGTMTDKEAAAFASSAKAHLLDFSAAREPIMLPTQACLANLNWRRFIDLRDLCLMRGGPRSGSRDMSLFWMVNFLGLSGVITAGNLEAEVKELAANFEGFGRDFRPVEDGSMSMLRERLALRAAGKRVVFRHADFDPLYTPTNEHLINLFEITPEEQARLSTLIGDQEKLRRADAKVPGRAERRQERAELGELARSIAAEMKDAGGKVVVSQIAARIGVSRMVATRLLNLPVTAQERRKRMAERTRGDAAHRDSMPAPPQVAEQVAGQAGSDEMAGQGVVSNAYVIAGFSADAASSRGSSCIDRCLTAESRPTDVVVDSECSVFSVSKGRGEERGGPRTTPFSPSQSGSAAEPSIPRIPSRPIPFASSSPRIQGLKLSSANFENSAPPTAPRAFNRINGRLTLVGTAIPASSIAAAERLTRGDDGEHLPSEEVIRRCEEQLRMVREDLADREKAADAASLRRFQATLNKVVARKQARAAAAKTAERPDQATTASQAAPCRANLASPFARFATQVVNQRTTRGTTGARKQAQPSRTCVTTCATNRAKSATTSSGATEDVPATKACATTCATNRAKTDSSSPDGGHFE